MVAGGAKLVRPSRLRACQKAFGTRAFASATFEITREAFVVLSATDEMLPNKKLNWTHAAAGVTLYSAQSSLNRSRHANLSGSATRLTLA